MYRRKSYRGDPHWIVTRYAGECAKCDAPFARGARVFYYPHGRFCYGDKCGCAAAAYADFEACAHDEAMMGG